MNELPESIKHALSLNLCKRNEDISNIIVVDYYDRVLAFTFNIGDRCFYALKHIDETIFNKFYRDLWLITETQLATHSEDINVIFDSGINYWALYEYTSFVPIRYYKLVFKQIKKPKNKFLTINSL